MPEEKQRELARALEIARRVEETCARALTGEPQRTDAPSASWRGAVQQK